MESLKCFYSHSKIFIGSRHCSHNKTRSYPEHTGCCPKQHLLSEGRDGACLDSGFTTSHFHDSVVQSAQRLFWGGCYRDKSRRLIFPETLFSQGPLGSYSMRTFAHKPKFVCSIHAFNEWKFLMFIISTLSMFSLII